MKRLLTLLALCAATLVIQPTIAQTIDNTKPLPAKGARKAHKGWRLVWADEFNGKKVDESSWTRCPENKPDWAFHMSPLDSLCRVRGGVLELHAVKRPEGYDDKRPYLTGGVWSKGKRSIQLGRIDVRARLDCAQGFWPAIWIMPDGNIGWPNGGEIDIMEHLNFEDKLYQTVHSPHTLSKKEPKSQSSFVTKIDPKVFNIYSVVINQDSIEFYLNNVKTATYERMTPAVAEQFPYADYPFYVILSAQLGGEWVGRIEPEDLPVQMDIDYVRFYERK